MVKRAAISVLGLAVLCGSGMPLRLPCCSLRKLETAALQSDCCPIPGCTLAEKAGPVAASIRESGGLEMAPGTASRLLEAAAALPGVAFVRVPSTALSPPRGRPSLSLLSVYRI